MLGNYFIVSCLLIVPVLSFEVHHESLNISSSRLFVHEITPEKVGWDLRNAENKIEYFARMSQSPDLPSWLNYVLDSKTSIGYLYGTPPRDVGLLDLDVIVLNRQETKYEVRKLIISITVEPKPEFAYIAEFKVDNLNPVDLCNPIKRKHLVHIFSHFLKWTHNDGTFVTQLYIGSPIVEGSDPALRLIEPEGTLIRLGSDQNFTVGMYKLQTEVAPLWKLRPCPKDMKRTSMEKHFRGQGFHVDWCTFELKLSDSLDPDSSTFDSPESNQETKMNEDRPLGETDEDIFHFKSTIPERSYGNGILLATLIPSSIGGIIAIILIAILWSDTDEAGPVDDDILFYEAAFRYLGSLFSRRNGEVNPSLDPYYSNKLTNSHYQFRQPEENESYGIRNIENDNHHRDISIGRETTPLPPQYIAKHPNGSPALTYAV